MIRIGPAGWLYADWKNIVYPKDAGSGLDPLMYLANFFDTIEINSTFYRPARVPTIRSWASRISHNPRFKFTLKLYRKFTHERGSSTAEDEKAVRSGLDVLAGEGCLGALLIQFPWSFKNTGTNRDHLASLLETYREYPLAVEVRHASWNRPAVYQSLARRSVAFCNIDQPLFADSIAPSALATTPSLGYVRLHGRNYENWFSENASVTERYDYLYTLDELREWVDQIRQVSDKSRETYVIANNHFRGQAIVNALEIKAQLCGEKVRGPASLLAEYPRLQSQIFDQ